MKALEVGGQCSDTEEIPNNYFRVVRKGILTKIKTNKKLYLELSTNQKKGQERLFSEPEVGVCYLNRKENNVTRKTDEKYTAKFRIP